MSMKNLGSKLASSVQQIKLKREQEAPATPEKPVAVAKAAAKLDAKVDPKPTAVSVAAKPVAPRAEQQIAASLGTLHPNRVWPD